LKTWLHIDARCWNSMVNPGLAGPPDHNPIGRGKAFGRRASGTGGQRQCRTSARPQLHQSNPEQAMAATPARTRAIRIRSQAEGDSRTGTHRMTGDSSGAVLEAVWTQGDAARQELPSPSERAGKIIDELL